MSAVYQTAAREVFTTSRLAEFCTQRELEKQTGHSADDWPVYVVKELLDNALDAAEEAGIAPEIEIEIGADRITISDNGPGIAIETVERLLDLGSRTSARANYVSPTRGAQGQAMSTIFVMPHALVPGSGSSVIIEAHGLTHRIAVHTNKLTGEPKLINEVSDGSVKSGTKVTVEWPESASAILADAYERFLPLAIGYVVANPHLSLRLQTPDDEEQYAYGAIEPTWAKWRACDPTSPHWYTPKTFGRLIAACIHKDQELSRRRPLRDFLGQFDGLSSTARRSKILTDLSLNRAALDDLVDDGGLNRATVAALLKAMQAETKPLKPVRLGIIGEATLRGRIQGPEVKGFKYAKEMGMDADGLPYVIEAAFAHKPDLDERWLISAVNFGTSPTLSFKFNEWRGARDVLTLQHAGPNEPVVVFLHVTHPSLTFTDLGKTQVALPPPIAADLQKVIEKITTDWHKQRKREERDASAELRRQDALERSRRVTIKDSVYAHLPAAYAAAAGDVGAICRQIFYKLRPLVLPDTGKDTLDGPYVMYTLIPDFITENPDVCADWTVFYDDRGHLHEPHTDEVIGLGTRNVRDYCSRWLKPIVSGFELSPPTVSTRGPTLRYGAILFCEKEGFTELFQKAKLPERFDLALASTKGTSVTACRELFEHAGRLGIPIFCLHDFDYNGFEIAATLHQDTRRYQFKHRPRVIDIGLRFDDVERLGLEAEPVKFGKSANALRKNLQGYGATPAEIEFLIDGERRVELNAMSTPQLIELIETALIEHGIRKVIPDANTLAATYRKQIEYSRASDAVEEAIRKARDELDEIPIPDDLADRVAAYLEENPTEPWETAVETLAGEQQ
jgi:DNA topoisomerase VI subunit B